MQDPKFYEIPNKPGILWDPSRRLYRKIEPIKQLRNGLLYEYYRATNQFIVRETVMAGMKLDFLEGVDLFSRSGCLIKTAYRIRNNTWTRESSQPTAERFLKEFLYSDVNIETHLEPQLQLLYKTIPGQLGEHSIERDTIINFIQKHEK